MALFELFSRRSRDRGTPWLDLATVRFVRGREINEEDTWRLLEWAYHTGADEFSITEIEIVGIEQDPEVVEILERLRPYSTGEAVRPTLTPPPELPFRRPVQLWKLLPQTVEILRRAFPYGLLSHTMGNSGWLEDPMFYRDGELLMGVVSHEAEAAVQGSPDDLDKLESAGITLYEQGEWI